VTCTHAASRSRAKLVVTSLVFVVLAHPSFAQHPCARLARLSLPQTVITSATVVPAGPYMGPVGPAGAPLGGALRLPAYCDVKGVIRSSPQSEVRFSVWLPLDSWNGSYRQEGSSGFGGLIPYWSMVDALARGYATAGTDGGHTVADWTGMTSAAWAVGQSERIIDFGYRAVHETSLRAKSLIAAFYERPLMHSYFVGCSEGGREALSEAQRFPRDFDGVLAASQGNNLTRLSAGFVWNEQAALASPAVNFSAATLKAVQEAAMRACDGLDGLVDALISNPQACRFDPSALRCKSADAGTNCLTPEQVDVLRKVYGGPRNPRTGRQISPGFPAGHEAIARTWSASILSNPPVTALQFVLGNSFFGQMAFQNPSWDFRMFNFDDDVQRALTTIGVIVDAANPDLGPFRAAGGKLLQYHGWADATVSPLNSVDYYLTVQSFLKASSVPGASAAMSDFYRLFMVPGMGHCGGGSGPTSFGNVGTGSVSLQRNPEVDVFSALERWVEQGIAPEQIIGTGVAPRGSATTLTRPLCMYPALATYGGVGDVNDARSFRCLVTSDSSSGNR